MPYGLPDMAAAATFPGMTERSEAQKDAERRYRANRRPVLIRFTPEEMKAIRAIAGDDVPAWVKAKALAAAKRAR